ncbi:MAG TPA: condensation domain-containing protein, partial [Pyrinomonadaceae bacterium]|nr:condensation domain-containing protein [Pyrinomonadaceae bacterium]
DAACRQLARGEEIRLPPKTTSFKQWAERLSRHARSSELKAELEYWRGVAGANAGRLRLDHPAGGNSVASAKTVTVSLDAETTNALLVEAPKAYNTQVNDLLLTALAESLAARGGSPALLVDLEGHGREDLFDGVDLSRTVGWFTSVFPVVLDAGASDEPGAALKAVKEHLRRIPSRGVGYGLLRYLSDDEETARALDAMPRAEVSFNYLGRFDGELPPDSPFDFADEPVGPQRSPAGERRHALDIIASVARGRLAVSWTYSAEQFDAETVEGLASEFVESLRALVAHCAGGGAKGFTPSDFPEADLSQEELDDILAEFGGQTE